MSVIEEQVEVAVPVRTAYNQWTQFESFPEFMEGVERVEQRTDSLTHWVTEIGGVHREFDAQIEHQVPDQRVSWRVIDGPKHDGTVSFTEIGGDRTKVSLRMEYEPHGIVEKVGAAVGAVGGRVRGDLRRFKEFIESHGAETGAWRGQVSPGGQVGPDDQTGRGYTSPGGPTSQGGYTSPGGPTTPGGYSSPPTTPGGYSSPGGPASPGDYPRS